MCVSLRMCMCRRAHMCVQAHARHAQATQQHAAPHLRLETSRYALLGLLSSCPRKVAQVVPVYVGTHSAGHVRARDSILANDGSARGLAGRAADCGVHKDMQHEEGGISGWQSRRGVFGTWWQSAEQDRRRNRLSPRGQPEGLAGSVAAKIRRRYACRKCR